MHKRLKDLAAVTNDVDLAAVKDLEGTRVGDPDDSGARGLAGSDARQAVLKHKALLRLDIRERAAGSCSRSAVLRVEGLERHEPNVRVRLAAASRDARVVTNNNVVAKKLKSAFVQVVGLEGKVHPVRRGGQRDRNVVLGKVCKQFGGTGHELGLVPQLLLTPGRLLEELIGCVGQL